MRKPTIWVPTTGPTQTGLYSHRRWLEAGNLESRGIVLSACSENKGTDQLRSYCEADLRLCFRICRLLVFPCGGSFSLSDRIPYDRQLRRRHCLFYFCSFQFYFKKINFVRLVTVNQFSDMSGRSNRVYSVNQYICGTGLLKCTTI